MDHTRALARAVLLAGLALALISAPMLLSVQGTSAAPRVSDPSPGPADHSTWGTATPDYAGGPKLANVLPAASPGDVVISEFRTRGLSGPADEFIEIFNRTCATVHLEGWTLRISNSTGATSIIRTFPVTDLVAGQYYLLAPARFDDGPDEDYTYTGAMDNAASIGIFDETNSRIDAVSTSATSAYLEGSPLPPLTVRSDKSYRRHTEAGMYVDGDNNATDFSLVDPPTPKNSLSTGTCGMPTVTPTVTQTFTPTNTQPVDCSLTPTPSSYARRAVMINEVAWSGTIASYADEWIELYNTNTACPVYLDGWRLEGVRSGSTTIKINFNASDVIAAGGYFIIAKNANVFQTGSVIIDKVPGANSGFTGSSSNALNDSGMTLYLFDNTGGLSGGEIIDTANIQGNGTGKWPAGNTSKYSMERYRNGADNLSNWVTYAGPTTLSGSAPRDRTGSRVRGTPRAANWALGVTITPSPKPTKYKTPTPRPPTPFAHMVINEFLPFPGSDWNLDGKTNVLDEFIELKNLGPIKVDLNGWQIDDLADTGSEPYDLPSIVLQPGDRTVIYGLESGILLDDSGDQVRLINSRGILIDSRTYGVAEKRDISICRIPDGYYWRTNCFPTPGNENVLAGSASPPAPPPVTVQTRPSCVLADTVPDAFRSAECDPFGSDIWDRLYWDRLAGLKTFTIESLNLKFLSFLE